MAKLEVWIENKIAQNLFVWFFLFLVLMPSIHTNDNEVIALFAVLFLIPPVYINNLCILPLLKKSTAVFIILFVVNTLVFSTILTLLVQSSGDLSHEWKRYFNLTAMMLMALIFASTLKMARDGFTKKQQEREAELKLLKAQLNPHFLFNTLNNLYGLSVVKSNKLPKLMLQLSDMLRYSLYETREATVPFENEVTYLKNYIALEKIRLEDKTEISLIEEVDFYGFHIAPMLLIVFVENAFKHLGNREGLKKSVTVSIRKEDGLLFFSCTNTIDKTMMLGDHPEKGKSGIGLENVKKRLELIYPNRHHLLTTEHNSTYRVDLKLEV